MKVFAHTLVSSVIRPSYYNDILQTRLRYGIKYYMILSLLLILIMAGAGIINYAPAIKSDSISVAREIDRDFPKDFTVTIVPGQISSNKEFPLIIQTPGALAKNEEVSSLPKILAVIDPNGEVGMFKQYETLMVINNTNLILNYMDDMETMPLRDLPPININYQTIQQISGFLHIVSTYSSLIVTLFFTISGLFDFFFFRIIYLAVFSFGLWLTYRTVMGTYRKAFHFSLHTITLPLLINTLFQIARFDLPIPFWFIIVHTIFTFYILNQLEKNPQN